jgi:hypothetical protein
VDFLFPGLNVPCTDNKGNVVSYESGSTVATALAAGFAGLLIFCSRLLGAKARLLQDQNSIRNAFKNTVAGWDPEHKFPRVQYFFEQRFREALARSENSSQAPEPVAAAVYDFSTMTWNDHCMEALGSVMTLISQGP